MGRLVEEVAVVLSKQKQSEGASRLWFFLVATALISVWSNGGGLPRGLASYLMSKNCWISRPSSFNVTVD
ncbi:unnamed protein product [Toxocara canis]|uniref:Uncharacterized protein n=1 Tax=Toxocara canis TaxID=6265 RepID=A0A183UMU5_TOXCA|nr:unnamed protein product [Toxocara canis]